MKSINRIRNFRLCVNGKYLFILKLIEFGCQQSNNALQCFENIFKILWRITNYAYNSEQRLR